MLSESTGDDLFVGPTPADVSMLMNYVDNYAIHAIENKAIITGTVNSISPVPDARGFYEMEFELQTSEDIEGLPNLARADEGSIIRIKTRGKNCAPGSQSTLTVKKSAGQVYFIQE